jgi:hypothetical protein
MIKQFAVCGAALALIGASLVAGPASAHHSYAMFDNATVKTITGTVLSWDWTNPHSVLEVMTADGEHYDFESASPSMLSRSGISRRSLKPGDKVIVEMHPRRDGGLGGSLVNVKLPDGEVLGFEAAHAAATQ